ncbi:MAG: hypothetical protein OHK93_001729 [Ramalina farinacea]|uniref:mRNA export factor GLE1 n=1 Tax=Ramalina farinacea TaxID=258253 RepID=A0AA43QQ40_9LECA|nr:hypothetical protein [Ramalina farinacea]
MSSPSRLPPDSPSRQLLRELGQLAISAQETFYQQLDRENEQKASLHKKALAAATAKHEKVRQSVELERQRLDAQVQAERERREAEVRRELEKQRREKAEREIEEKRREAERAKAFEAEQSKRDAIEKSRKEAADAAQARQREQAEAARKAQDEKTARQQQETDQAKARAQAAAKASSQQTQTTTPPKSQPTQLATPKPTSILQSTTPKDTPPVNKNVHFADSTIPTATPPQAQSSPTSDPQVEAEHAKYLTIHRRLKEMRAFMVSEAKTNKDLKQTMGDMRRSIQKSVGQLVEPTKDNKGINRQPHSTILTTLKNALTLPSPTIAIAPFFANPPPLQNNTADPNGPALLIYLLNIFCKAVIAQFIAEAGVKPQAADPVGIITSHIFAQDVLKWQGVPLIDILLAKYHLVCPLLFGIRPPSSTTDAQKPALGWWREEGSYLHPPTHSGPFIPPQQHYQRLTGLSAGFAALSLRNYSKAPKMINPFPDNHYWTCLARIANTPPDQLTESHFVVIKGLVECFAGKFVGFYGGAAVCALRVVVVDLPGRAKGEGGGRGGV